MLGMIAVPDYLTYWRTGLVCYSFGEVTPQKQYEEGGKRDVFCLLFC